MSDWYSETEKAVQRQPYLREEIDKLKRRIVVMGDLLVKAHYALGNLTPDDGAEVYTEIDKFLKGAP